MEITETVTMTDPANANENAIVFGGTTLTTFVLFSLLEEEEDDDGWQNTTAAPMHVDNPAIVDK